MEFYANPPKRVHFKNVYRRFYEITIALFASLFLFYVSQAWESLTLFHDHPVWLILIFAIIFVAIEGLYRWKWKRHFDERVFFRAILRNDIEGFYRSEWDMWFKSPYYPREIIDNALRRGF